MRMRTINEASEYFIEQDPSTALTKTAIRRLITTGTIPSVRIGNKYLVAIETLEKYLSGEIAVPEAPEPTSGKIRRIEVKQ